MPTKTKKPPRKRTPKSPSPPITQALATVPEDPHHELRYVWCGPVGGVTVNEFTVLKISAVLACIRYIATTIATTDYNVYELLRAGGKEYRPEDPVDWLLDKQANPETPAIIFWETMLLWAILWGNAYAEIERDMVGRPLWLWQLAPDRVCLERDRATGEQVYVVDNNRAPPSYLDPANVLHVRGLSWDGQIGYDIARLCKEVFGGPMAAQDFANAFFGNDATPGFALTTPNALSQTAITRLMAAHNNDHQGPHRAHKMKIFEEGIMPVKLGANAEETQLVEVQQFYVEQVARVFGVPLTKIGHMIHSGNRANMEEDDRAAYKQCLRPWSRKVECEVDIKLFGRQRRGRFISLHDFSVLLRGNSEQMTNQTCQLLDRGVYDTDEARDIFDLNPIGGKLGKTRLGPRNFTTLDKVGEDPVPAGGGGTPGDSPGAGQNNSPPGTKANAPLWDGFRLVFEEICRCSLKKEALRMQQVSPKITRHPGAFAQWGDKLCQEQREYIEDRINTGAIAVTTALQSTIQSSVTLDRDLKNWCDQYAAALASRLQTDPVAWEALASPMADELITLVKGVLCPT